MRGIIAEFFELKMVEYLWEDKRLDSYFHSRFPGEIGFHAKLPRIIGK